MINHHHREETKCSWILKGPLRDEQTMCKDVLQQFSERALQGQNFFGGKQSQTFKSAMLFLERS